MDLYECRIEANLKTMSETLLLSMPKAETWTTDYFLQQSQQCFEAGAAVLNFCSKNVEVATRELLDTLRTTAYLPSVSDSDSEEVARSKKEEVEAFDTECDTVFKLLQQRDHEAIVTSQRSTLEAVRKRISPPLTSSIAQPLGYHSKSRSQEEGQRQSLFQASLVLCIPNIIMQPSLEDMQVALNQAMNNVTEVSAHVHNWPDQYFTASSITGMYVCVCIKVVQCTTA